MRKTAKFIEKLALENKAVAAVGSIGGKAKERMERDKGSKLKHRIHQWNVSTLTKLLEEKPIHVIKVSEKGSSSTDPFTGVKIKNYTPLVIRYAVKGLKRVKMVKTVLRIARVDGRTLERDVIGAINIGLKHLSDGSLVALGLTDTHDVREASEPAQRANPANGT